MSFRFLLPVAPLLFFLAQEGLFAIVQPTRLASDARTGRAGLAVAVALLCLVAVLPLRNGMFIDAEGRPRFFAEVAVDYFRPHEATVIGRFLGERFAAEYTVGSEFAGILGYEMPQRLLDTFGLTDGDIPGRGFAKSPFGSAITDQYLMSRSPELVVPCVRLYGSSDAAWRATLPGGGCRSWIGLTGAGTGYEACVLEIRPGAYWPAILKSALPEREALCVTQSS
jgi:hypothetical protein